MSRLDKVNSLLKKQISEVIQKKIELPLGILVTVSEVETSSNLGNANVWASIIPKKREEEVLEILEKKIYEIQKELNSRISMRHVPKIRFVIDFREERAASIEDIIEQENKKNEN